MKNAILTLLLFCALTASAAQRITLTITVTNAAVTGNTLVVNSASRYFTNANSVGTILTNLVGKNETTTNLYNQIASFPYAGPLTLQYSGTNSIKLVGTLGGALAASSAGNWSVLTLSTQTAPATFTQLWPIENIPESSNRIGQASAEVSGASTYSTNAIATNSTMGSNFVHKGAGPVQTVPSALNLLGIIRSYVAFYATNGTLRNFTFINPQMTNGTNHGLAFSSPGLGTESEQFGAGAYTGGDYGTSIGAGAGSTNASATAVGRQSFAGETGTAVGSLATANTNSVAVGFGARAAGYGNAVFGQGADDNDFYNVSIFGNSASATRDNLALFGSSGQYALFKGNSQFELGTTNHTLFGTNILNGRLDAPARSNTTLANGYNSGVIFGTNLVVEFSGPSGAYTNAGFAAPGGPQIVWAQFDNPGLSFTILNESGLDAVAANRILTDTGGLLNSTNRTVFVGFRYDIGNGRWRILSFR